jgi:YD repeat-containing protein
VTGKAYSAQTCANGQLPSGAAAVSYVYDQGANAIGHLSSLTDGAGSAAYGYDILGRMASETRTINGVTKSMSYGHNLDGSPQSLTYPSGATVTYAPWQNSSNAAAGVMQSAVDNGNGINYATSATYSPDLSLTGFVSGASSSFAGITNSFTFNKRLQPVNFMVHSWFILSKNPRMSASSIQFTRFREMPTFSASSAWCGLRPGRTHTRSPESQGKVAPEDA